MSDAEEDKKKRYGIFDVEIFERQDELSDKEFRVYSAYCFERWRDTGLMDLSLKEIARKYKWNYDSLCRYHASLRRKVWLRDSGQGVILLVGFDVEKTPAEIAQESELRRLKTTDEKSVTEENPLIIYQCQDVFTDEKSVNDVFFDGKEVISTDKLSVPTDEKSVTEENPLTNYQSSLPYIALDLNTQKFKQEEEEGNTSASADSGTKDLTAKVCGDSTEPKSLPVSNLDTPNKPLTSSTRERKGLGNPQNAKSVEVKDEIRRDLKQKEWLEWLEKQPENKGVNIQILFTRMISYCRKEQKTVNRQRFISWLAKEREDIPVDEADFQNEFIEVKNAENKPSYSNSKYQSNAEKRAERIRISRERDEQLIREGYAELESSD